MNPVASVCEGKECYATKARAIVVIKRRQRRAKRKLDNHKERRREVAKLNTYRCTQCHHWHIGTGHPGRPMR